MNADEVVWFDLVTDEEYPDSEVSISKRGPTRRMRCTDGSSTFRGLLWWWAPKIREQVVFGPSRCDFPTFLAKSDLLAVLSGHPSAWRVRSGSTPKMDTQSKSCTRAPLCLIPCFLRPNGSCGRAENEREYGGDDKECPSGNNGVDRAERWYRPSGDEVADHAR